MDCAKRMKDIITDTGRRQDWVAKQMHMSQGRLSRLLNGKGKLTADELIAFCEATHTSPQEFFRNTRTKMSNKVAMQ